MWNPYLYPLMFPRLPRDNPKPPTIYSILESIVNFGKDEKTKIKDLAKEGRTEIFDFDYPLSSHISKEEFETMILNKFIMRRIGFDTVTAFKIQLNVKLNEIMPMYNKMFDFLDGWDLFSDGEITTRTKNYTGNANMNNTTNTSTNNISDRRYSELPQDEISNVRDGKYMTDYNYDNDSGTGNTISNTTSADSNSENETITRTPSDKMTLYKEFLENKKNIYTMIFKDLESLFYGLL